MAKYSKFNSNYIKTERHQHLKDGSTIFERDWVTVGSQLHFGPNKIPYYTNGNFIFTKANLPFYQKKHKNGTTVATWTYEDVKDATSIVNNVSFEEYTEDIRSYAYYGSCVELVRASVNNIIKTFPGMITKNPNTISWMNYDESEYVDSGYYGLKNDFGIDLVDLYVNKGEDELKYLRVSYGNYLLNGKPITSYDIIDRGQFMLKGTKCISNRKQLYSYGFNFYTKKQHQEEWVNERLKTWKQEHPDATDEEISNKKAELFDSYDSASDKTINKKKELSFTLNYNPNGNTVVNGITGSCYYQFGIGVKPRNDESDTYIRVNNKKSLKGPHGQDILRSDSNEYKDFINTHHESNQKDFTIPQGQTTYTFKAEYNYKTYKLTITCKDRSNRSIYNREFDNISLSETFSTSGTVRLGLRLFNEYSVEREYNYLQYVSDDEKTASGEFYDTWDRTNCKLQYWTETTSFKMECDSDYCMDEIDPSKGCYKLHDWATILYSKYSDVHTLNRPLYTINIQNEDGVSVNIFAYIIDYDVVFMTDFQDELEIRPNDEIIDKYFDSLEGFEKKLLTRDSKPLYSNQFVTPLEYNLGYVYYNRTYTWPSNGYCIDITSTAYVDFINKILKMADTYDELWTDNMWRRMTHEAIKNYDWTYTRRYNDGEEEPNVEGGERMHKVINIIGRVFDDIKRTIDTIKHFNRVTYNSDRNIPNALLSDKLELNGWDVFSTIPTRPKEIEESEETEEETDAEVFISASNDIITNEFLDENGLWWYPTKNNEQVSFADVDIDWMRRLFLSSKRIFSTKGTIQSIDMVMGMFGYGNIGRDKCYEIREEYYIVKPRNYDEDFIYTNNKKDDFLTIEEFNQLPQNDERRNLYHKETFGDMIVYLNNSKYMEKDENDDASGIPITSFVIERYGQEEPTQNYIIPFYTQKKWYDGDLYFQQKGGWFYTKTENEKELNAFGWNETIPYLHVVSQVEDLLNINPRSLSVGDIYYATSVNDYYTNTETGLPLSNFFVIENEYSPEEFSSWTNIDITGNLYEDIEFDEENATEEEIEENEREKEENKKYRGYAEKARYLADIIPDTVGNNPHIGFGVYDNGKDFFDYMKQPFKFSFENAKFDYELEKPAKEVKFDITGPIIAGNNETVYYVNNIQITDDENNEIQPYEKTITEEEYNNLDFADKLNYIKSDKVIIYANGYNVSFGNADDGRQNLVYKEYILDNIVELKKERYFLNSKVLYFTNLIKNNLYIKYFKDVIVKYLMQVIPSTTILILEGFDEIPEEVNNEEENNNENESGD